MKIIFEDDAVIAVDKPAGVTVIPARDEAPELSLQKSLERARGEKLWVVHRLDRDTSGVLLFARTAAAHRELSMAFESHSIEKTYLAWTRGNPSETKGTVTLALHPARRGRMRPARPDEAGALASQTSFEVLAVVPTKLGPVARVQAQPRSGRQHQIRVHMRSLGAPLLVDDAYGKCERLEVDALGEHAPAMPRLTLHAQSLSLSHPVSRTRITIFADLPEDLAALDAWLEGQRTSSR